MSDIALLLQEATSLIAKAQDFYALELLRSKYLGKKGQLTEILKTLGSLDQEERRRVGQVVNEVKTKVFAALQARQEQLKNFELEAKLAEETIDVTLPGRGLGLGGLHPLTQVRRRMEKFFSDIGFTIFEGPEIEDDYHNFAALNFPEKHPARAEHDTFYLEKDHNLLRTHTSPSQIRAMQTLPLPLRVITPGRVYRCDSDATHSPMFHQLEGFVIDENINFANLKWILKSFLEYFFARPIKTRFRPSYFPFTEPSAEVDIWWEREGQDAGRWLEVLGCGMIHPNVLRSGGIDSSKYTGFAFGMGIDRFTMLYFDGLTDLRMFFENDLRFLEQF